jgi:hypothetical protein
MMQVACLQAQLIQLKSQLSHNIDNNQWIGNNNVATTQPMNYPFCPTYMNPISPQSSLESSIDHSSSMNDGMMSMQDVQSSREDFSFQACNNSKKNMSYNNNHHDLGELQEIALRMMKNFD